MKKINGQKLYIYLAFTLFTLSLFNSSSALSAISQKEDTWVQEEDRITYSYVETHDDGEEYSYVVTIQLTPEYKCLMPEIAVLFMKGRALGKPISQEQVDPSALLIVFDKENAYRNLTFKTKYTNGVEYGTRLTNDALNQFKSSKTTIFKLIDQYFVITNNQTLPSSLKKVSKYCFDQAKGHY